VLDAYKLAREGSSHAGAASRYRRVWPGLAAAIALAAVSISGWVVFHPKPSGLSRHPVPVATDPDGAKDQMTQQAANERLAIQWAQSLLPSTLNAHRQGFPVLAIVPPEPVQK
jgi:hypothetical protein